MKRIYYLAAFMLVLFTNCSREVNTTEHLYLCNALEKNITLTLFKGEEIFEYEIRPNDTIFLNTIYSGYVTGGGLVNCDFPPRTDRLEYLYSFDSATVAYDSLLYNFSNDRKVYYDSNNTSVLLIISAYPTQINSIGDYSYYTYNKKYLEDLDREIKNLPF